jgi:hypothetical protein
MARISSIIRLPSPVATTAWAAAKPDSRRSPMDSAISEDLRAAAACNCSRSPCCVGLSAVSVRACAMSVDSVPSERM